MNDLYKQGRECEITSVLNCYENVKINCVLFDLLVKFLTNKKNWFILRIVWVGDRLYESDRGFQETDNK